MSGRHSKQRRGFGETAAIAGLSFSLLLGVAGDTGPGVHAVAAHGRAPAPADLKPGTRSPKPERSNIPGRWLQAANSLLTIMSGANTGEGDTTTITTTTHVRDGKRISMTEEVVRVPLNYGNTLILRAVSDNAQPPTPDSLQAFDVQAVNADNVIANSTDAELNPAVGWTVTHTDTRVHDGKSQLYYQSVGEGQACAGFTRPVCQAIGNAAVLSQATAMVNRIPAEIAAIQAGQVPGMSLPPQPPVLV